MNYYRRLYWWNIAVAIVHGSSFIALLVISLVELSEARFVNLWSDVNETITSLGSYQLFATLLPFPAITSFVHILAAVGVDNYYAKVINLGINRLRWIEYAITNGLMSWSLTVVAGQGNNVVLAIVTVLSNFIMQWYGYEHERRRFSLEPLLFGVLPWVINWMIVFTYYGARISTTSVTDGLAIFGSFIWSISFTLPLFWRLTKKSVTKEVNYRVEVAYILLSLTAKLWLDWVLTIGNLVQ